MRRPVLLTIAALGGLVCVLAGTGLFAALTDTARTGTNSVESAALAASADIQLATATGDAGSGLACGTFSEDLSSPFLTVSDVSPGYSSAPVFYCIKNVGSQQVTLSALTDALTDVDFACTGDESLHGDTTCGADGAGELSSVLRTAYNQFDCAGGTVVLASVGLDSNTSTPFALGTIAPGATRCFYTTVGYPGSGTTPGAQKAQSDRVTWRYKWVAQA